MTIHLVEAIDCDSSYLLATLYVCTGSISEKVLEVGEYFNLVVIEKRSWTSIGYVDGEDFGLLDIDNNQAHLSSYLGNPVKLSLNIVNRVR